MKTEALHRAIRRGTRRADAEACGLCAAPLPGDHLHLLDTDDDHPICVCRPCMLLFDRPGAALGRYRPLPRRRVPVAQVKPAALGVPVGLAFFVRGDDGTVTARYPSPAGATRWEVDTVRWEAATRECPPAAGMAPRVEALLVNAAKGRTDAWVVPVSDCYRLVAVIRRYWRGLSGGDRVWPEIERFFDDLRETAWEGSG